MYLQISELQVIQNRSTPDARAYIQEGFVADRTAELLKDQIMKLIRYSHEPLNQLHEVWFKSILQLVSFGRNFRQRSLLGFCFLQCDSVQFFNYILKLIQMPEARNISNAQ
jgi:hypothetical protein